MTHHRRKSSYKMFFVVKSEFTFLSVFGPVVPATDASAGPPGTQWRGIGRRAGLKKRCVRIKQELI